LSNLSSPTLPRICWHLTQVAAHLVVALIALLVIGGATRVMEAGLACPDWPLCYGSFLPGKQMNVQVFLEWFHRLDAFLVGLALLVQFGFSFLWRSLLPKWLPWIYGVLVILVAIQGGLGAMTVLNLLPSTIVSAHLFLALLLIAITSALTQILQSKGQTKSPLWWKIFSCISLVAVISQSLLGARMATTWASKICIDRGDHCYLLNWHRISAIPVALIIIFFVIYSLASVGWTRSQWPFLLMILMLLIAQVSIGYFSINLELSQPILTISHQLIAALLVAFLSALIFRSSDQDLDRFSKLRKQRFLEACHG